MTPSGKKFYAVANLDLSHTTPGDNKNLGQHDFLRMIVAQVQNQDSIQEQPKDECLSHLASFGKKEKTKIKDSLHQMTTSLQSNQALQASALVGRKVLIYSDSLTLNPEKEVKIAIDIPEGVENPAVFIYSKCGKLLASFSLGQHGAGIVPFTWDGIGYDDQRLNPGIYKFKVNGVSDGQMIDIKTLISANIDSVSLGQNGEGLKLKVRGVGLISLDQVKEITL